MIRKLSILLYKDLLIIINDRAGLGYLFIMPVFLVFIMVTIQDTSFKSIRNLNIKILVQNDDRDTLGNTIVNELKKSGFFRVSEISEIRSSLTPEQLVIRSDFKMYIRIPDSTTFRLKKMIAGSRTTFLTAKNRDVKPDETSDISIYFTPLITISNKVMILSLLRECSMRIENKLLINSIRSVIPALPISDIPRNSLIFSERTLKNYNSEIIPDSTQHNVPAWTLFAMFFIVMSLAGNIIREREEKSFVRLLYMPFRMSLYLSSKLIIYFFVGMIQLLLMLLMGIYVLPMAGFPALAVSGKIISIIVIGSASSLAAVGFGLVIGTFTQTYQQASSLGAISVVILAAIGGVWVPVMAMPQFMQKLSVFSPLNWGLEGFHKILVADMSFKDCGKELFLLLLFFIICTSVSMKYFTRRRLFNF
jgi:ABC-2 type transport system permease protein